MNRQGPRPLIDADELAWAVVGIAAIVALTIAALIAGLLAGLIVFGFRLTSGG